MNLRVKFKDEMRNELIVNLPCKYIGTKQIDIIRKKVGYNLELEKIDGKVPEIKIREYVMKIDEKDARALNICTENGIEEFHTEENSLNKLFVLKPYILTDDTEKIVKVWMEWTPSYDKIINFIEKKYIKGEESFDWEEHEDK